ncbi:hypothetical protein VHEMI07609 [[Torrubiella] hemipterigena]|uniref:Zn(2)-C6 fungal-type domain-containing protein n=1 Tax=[Torrubiella] hemipterigena TaxID=1531966 RepID=A0A0A1T411_9HYPO|nr:hypothetical protein VHEMI07609 [[Torrubiella] hemipterigena]
MSAMSSAEQAMRNAGGAPACLRCRQQKLKCSRERPSCARCNRARQACHYAAPPDRRRIAARHAGRRRNREGQNPEHQPTNECSNLPTNFKDVSILQNDSIGKRYTNTSNSSIFGPMDGNGIAMHSKHALVSREVAMLLIEIYFQRHYQAALLLDKQRFLTDYSASSDPSFLSLAVFAFASLFLDMSDQASLAKTCITIDNLYQTDWAAVGEQWAELASREALVYADKPSVMHVQALQTTGLFWFAKSQIARAAMHFNTALQCAYMLGYNKIHVSEAAPLLSQDDKRRISCFWACWLTQCSNQSTATYYRCWNSVAGLPALVSSNQAGPEVHEHMFFDELGNLHSKSSTISNERHNNNTHLLQMFGLWSEIREFVISFTEKKIQDDTTWIPRLWALDDRLESLLQNLPDAIRYPGGDIGDYSALQQAINDDLQTFNLGYMCHMLFCFLHATVIPALSGSLAAQGLPRHLARASSKQIIDHSLTMMSMARTLLSKSLDLSQLWPVVGYAAQFCVTVQIRCSQATGSSGPRFLEHAQPNLALCKELQKYWSSLRALNHSLQHELTEARGSQVARPNDSSMFDAHMNATDVENCAVELLGSKSLRILSTNAQSVYMNFLGDAWATREKHHQVDPAQNDTEPQDQLNANHGLQRYNSQIQSSVSLTDASVAPTAANSQIFVWDDSFFNDSMFLL